VGADVLVSCTVEMLQIGLHADVAVIDEIQMIGDPQRGSGWTHAVLGLCAKEIHLCGEETAVPLIRELLKETGDEIIVNRYERLTPLEVEQDSLDGDLSRVQKGDCIVAFSRSAIFALKRQVEMQTGMRCAVVYGKLPPEIRSEQAALFNDPDSGYDVLIGSDAIGMGLNLYAICLSFSDTCAEEATKKNPPGDIRICLEI
jgi:ATP-dependent RNA helicase SUPV3L1/SUV3